MVSFRDIVAVKTCKGSSLSKEQIDWFISALVNGEIEPCQTGAFLMAVFINGMNQNETTWLTKAMMNSGEVLSWPGSSNVPIVDKHSTGGVGDKVSLPLMGTLIASGLKVPMISGRSLGHTGGTLDKLESIPGFNVNQSADKMTKILNDVGGCIVGQTGQLVPADKMMYAIRDVSGTVASIPLTVSSIISKKAAEGIGSLVLDVKTGAGAFMKSIDESIVLASAMVKVCQGAGIKSVAIITDMNSPLGSTVGNSLEVIESINLMKGSNASPDLEELVCMQGAHLLHMNGLSSTVEDGINKIRQTLKDGTALNAFRRMMIAQGVPSKVAKDVCDCAETAVPLASYRTTLYAPDSGLVASIDPMRCASVCTSIGAGRQYAKDVIDHGVGIKLETHVGGYIKKGDAWAVVYHSSETLPSSLRSSLDDALTIQQSSDPCVTTTWPSRFVKLISPSDI